MSKAFQCLQCGEIFSTSKDALNCSKNSNCKPNPYSKFVAKTVKTTIRPLNVVTLEKASPSSLISVRESKNLANVKETTEIIIQERKKVAKLPNYDSSDEEESQVSVLEQIKKKEYPCVNGLCDYKGNVFDLAIHYSLFHYTKWFTCFYCGKCFSSKSILKTHGKVHGPDYKSHFEEANKIF